jgi:hypothetical protein
MDRFREEGLRCLLAKPIRRCPYFEECVMPMTVGHKNPAAEAKMRDQFVAGIRKYKRATGLSTGAPVRICPNCKKRPLEAGKKLCAICRAEKRKETKRASRRKHAGSRQFSEKSPSMEAVVL